MTVPEAKRQRRENMLDTHEGNNVVPNGNDDNRSVFNFKTDMSFLEIAHSLESNSPQPGETVTPANEDSVMTDSSQVEEPETNGHIVPLDSTEVSVCTESILLALERIR